jgi:7-carboxy-7-deazaguanine synthase
VLSGGEPMRQNIAPLVIALLHSGKHVQIETNGTFFVDLPFDDPMLTIVCSPKSPSLNERIVQHVDAWKYVVRAGCISDEDGLPLHALGNDFGVARPPIPVKRNEIFIQPLDEGSMAQEMIYASEHVKAALAVCVKHGYRLSIQTHKLLGLE